MSEEDRLNSALNIMRRMPPANTVKSVAGLMELCPEISEDILGNVDQPLQTQKDEYSGKDYIICDYNRDGDAYRSPFSNKYYDEEGQATEGFTIPENLRKMEIEANRIFDVYRHQYFGAGLSSVYFFESEDSLFGATFLIHKDVDGDASLRRGCWDSTHVMSVSQISPTEFNYTLTSTVIISMNLFDDKTGDVDLSGSLTQQVERKKKISPTSSHISNMGTMIEEMETAIRNKIEGMYYDLLMLLLLPMFSPYCWTVYLLLTDFLYYYDFILLHYILIIMIFPPYSHLHSKDPSSPFRCSFFYW